MVRIRGMLCPVEQVDALDRLVHGYDVGGINELIKRGIDKAIVKK